MIIEPNSKLLFIGDSITDCGRQRPVGTGTGAQAMGDGFVRLVAEALAVRFPTRGIELLNTGISGDTVRDLDSRWQTDVLDLEPDWLSVMIGINDVWGQFMGFGGFDEPISSLEYRMTLGRLLAAARPRLKGLVLMTPYYLEPNRRNPVRSLMDEFGDQMRALAQEHGAVFVDTQAVFDELMETVPPTTLAEDRVHVGRRGHQALAGAFLSAVDFPAG